MFRIVKESLDSWLVFAIALLVRLASYLYWAPGSFYKYQFFVDLPLNKSNLSYFLPHLSFGYFSFLWILRHLMFSWPLIVIVQIIVSAATASLVYALTKKLTKNRIVALIAGSLAIFSRDLIVYSNILEPESIYPGLLVFAAWLWTCRAGEKRFFPLVLGGVLGLIALFAVAYLPVVVLFLLFIWRLGKKGQPINVYSYLGPVTFLVAGAILVIYFISGYVVPLRVCSGEMLFCAHSPYALPALSNPSPQYQLLPHPPFPDAEHLLSFTLAKEQDPKIRNAIEANQYWRNCALEFIASHPILTLKRVASRFLIFFSSRDMHDIKTLSLNNANPFMLVNIGLLIPFALLGLVMVRFASSYFLVNCILANAVLNMVFLFIINSRYRVPAIPFITIYAAIGIYNIVDKNRQGHYLSKALIIIFGFCLVMVADCLVDIQLATLPATTKTKAINVSPFQKQTATKVFSYLLKKQDVAAEKYLQKMKITPQDSPLCGIVLWDKGDLTGAIKAFSLGEEHHPDDPVFQTNLFNCYLANTDFYAANKYLIKIRNNCKKPEIQQY